MTGKLLFLLVIALFCLLTRLWPSEAPPPPFITINCTPEPDGHCKSVEFPATYAYRLYWEVVSGFKIRGYEAQPLNPRLELGAMELGATVQHIIHRDMQGAVIGDTVRMGKWNEVGFALGWCAAVNNKLPNKLEKSELNQIATQAIIATRASVSVKELKAGK